MIARRPASAGDLSVAGVVSRGDSTALVVQIASPTPISARTSPAPAMSACADAVHLADRDQRPAADQRRPHRASRHDGPLRGGPQVIDRIQRRRQRTAPFPPPGSRRPERHQIPGRPRRVRIIVARPCRAGPRRAPTRTRPRRASPRRRRPRRPRTWGPEAWD